MLWGPMLYYWRVDCSGLMCPCVTEFREPRGAGGRAGSQFLLPSSLALAAPGCGALGGLGPQDVDFRSPKCSGAWGRVVVHVQEPGSLGILCAPS